MRPMRVVNYVAAVGLVVATIMAFEIIDPFVSGATVAQVQVLLLVLLCVARFWGMGPGLAAAAVGGVGSLVHLSAPGAFVAGDLHDWAALLAFVVMAFLGGDLARRAERRAVEAQRQRAEIEDLYAQLKSAFDRASEAEAAVRSERLKATLLDALTHNLRTPLTAIKASVTALKGGHGRDTALIIPEVRRELLQVIDEETDRLNRFIEGLSSASGPAAGPPSFAAVQAKDIIDSGLTRAASLTRDHRVVVSIGADLPSVWVDPASVAEVIYMLLDNASKYSPAGTTILVHAGCEGEHHVRISVADEGPGIPDELRERVFEKFYRIPARAPQDPRRLGIGLGLPIARRLIEAQGGRLWIETPSGGRGTMAVMDLLTTDAASAAERTVMAAVAG